MNEVFFDKLVDTSTLRILAHTGNKPTLDIIFLDFGLDTQAHHLAEYSLELGHHVLFIEDPNRTWLNADGLVSEIAKTIEDYLAYHKIDDVNAIGKGHGGFAAIYFAGVLQISNVLALGPQYTIDQEKIQDARFEKDYRAIAKLRVKHAFERYNPVTNYFIIHSAASDEQAQYLEFPNDANVHHYLLRKSAVDFIPNLVTRGKLREVLKLALAGDVPAFEILAQDLSMLPALKWQQQLRPERFAKTKDRPENFDIRLITDEPELIAWKYTGQTDTLNVVFISMGARNFGKLTYEFVGRAIRDTHDHVLFIGDPMRRWLNTPDYIARVIQMVENHARTHNIKTINTIGTSLGGFMALYFAGVLPVDNALAFVPQYSINPTIVNEHRWGEYTKQEMDFIVDHCFEHINPKTNYFAVHGAARLDRHQYIKFPSFKNLHHYIMVGAFHNVPNILRSSGHFDLIINAAFAGDIALFDQIARQRNCITIDEWRAQQA